MKKTKGIQLAIWLGCVLTFAYFYVWNILVWDEFTMVYSEKLSVKAAQGVVYVIWSGLTCFLGFPAFMIAMFTINSILEGDEKKSA